MFEPGLTEDEKEEICIAENICAEDDRIKSWKVDDDNENTLYNWHQKLGLECQPVWKVGFIASCFFIGWCCMYWLPKYADRFGRRSFFILICLANTILYTLLMIGNSMYLMMLVLFGFGLVTSGRAVVGWMYMMELIPLNDADLFGTVFQGINSSIYTVATLYFWFFCKDWWYFTSIGYIL